MAAHRKMDRVLRSLNPESQEERHLLKSLIEFAQAVLKGSQSDLSHGQASLSALRELQVPTSDVDVQRYVDILPEEKKKYLYSLIEALDIYHNIRGTHPISVKSHHELRQIRDMCLHEGLKAPF